MRYYPTDVKELTDQELNTLAEEIVASGLLDGDEEWEAIEDYGPETWQRQAYDRWHELIREQHRRRDIANPPRERTEAEKAYDTACRQMASVLAAEMFIFGPQRSAILTGIAVPGTGLTAPKHVDGGTYIQRPFEYKP